MSGAGTAQGRGVGTWCGNLTGSGIEEATEFAHRRREVDCVKNQPRIKEWTKIADFFDDLDLDQIFGRSFA
jgi:hypothetical protein